MSFKSSEDIGIGSEEPLASQSVQRLARVLHAFAKVSSYLHVNSWAHLVLRRVVACKLWSIYFAKVGGSPG